MNDDCWIWDALIVDLLMTPAISWAPRIYLTIVFTLKNRSVASHKHSPRFETCYWRFYQLTQWDANEYENKYISRLLSTIKAKLISIFLALI